MSFVLGGKTAAELGIVMLRQSQRPILPATEDRAIAIDGHNGGYDFGADINPRLFSLECAFIESNYLGLQAAVDRLAAWLLDSYGKPRTMDLTFDARPDKTYRVRYSGSLQIDRVSGYGTFTLPLLAYDPWAAGPEQIVETTVTASPTTILAPSSGDIRAQPIIIMTNQGGTTLPSIKLVHEYLLEG